MTAKTIAAALFVAYQMDCELIKKDAKLSFSLEKVQSNLRSSHAPYLVLFVQGWW